jgi:hypothetical protein
MAARGPEVAVNVGVEGEVARCINTGLELVPQPFTLKSSVSESARIRQLRRAACDKKRQKLREHI